MEKISLEDFLGDFMTQPPAQRGSIRAGGPVTIWLPAEAKARYDKLQRDSGQRFSKIVRAAMLALMVMAEARLT